MTPAHNSPPPVRVPSATLADFAGSRTLGAALDALGIDAADVAVEGVRLAGQDSGGSHDLLVTESVPSSIPAGVVAVVTRRAPRGSRDVPVLVASEGAPWGDVLADVCDVVGAARGRRAAARARRALRVPLVDGGGWDRLAEVCAGLVGAAVVIVDDHVDVVARHGAGADALAETVGDATSLADLEGATEACTQVPVHASEDRAVAAVLVDLPAPLSTAEAVTLNEMAVACALEWSRQELRTSTESQLRGDLIRELVAGESISRESLIRRGRHLGADLSAGAVAVLGTIGDPAAEEPGDDRVVRRLLRQARGVIDLHWPRALLDWDAGRLLVLLPGPREEEADRSQIEERAHALATRLVASTAEMVPDLTLAISRFTPDPEKLGSALDEAGLALSIGSRLGRAGGVITFEEIGTYKLLFQIFAESPQELAVFYEQTIEPLVRYDEQYQTELVGTMSTYLELDCNLAATASTLYTHRHTVRYRLDRIAELSGLDIGRTDDREKLTLGLKAMRLLGKRVPVPMAKEASARQGR